MIPKRDRLKLPRQDPVTRPAKERIGDFREIYALLDAERAIEQANRCILCKHEPCVVACPAENHIPQWLELCADGKFMDAAKLSHETSNLPEICGRICPQDRLCEKDCVIGIKGDPVPIGAIEAFINEWAFANGYRPELNPERPQHSEKVAVVGAGPAGLACAEELAQRGYAVTVFDAYKEPGGLLIYGIPGFKLEKEVVERRIGFIRNLGVKFVCNRRIGKDITLTDLFNQGFAAIYLGHGAMQPKVPGLPGDDIEGIYEAIPFLIRNNLREPYIDSQQTPRLNLQGKEVVVLGGGDTAMDCVRTSARLQAKSVTCVYRRDEENMPGSRREIKAAKEEGVKFLFYTQPLRFQADSQGKLQSITCQKMQLGEPDDEGRRRPLPMANSEFTIRSNFAIIAFGFDPTSITGKGDRQLETSSWQGLKVDENFMTSWPGVFAGGDNVRGADLIVTAMADGRKAAGGIDRYLHPKEK